MNNTPDVPQSDIQVDEPEFCQPHDELPELAESFADLSLSKIVVESLLKVGFEKPTIIQSLFIPKAMTGQDVMGQAKTGTGKTGAFLIPIFERLKPGHGETQALILAPTRELAMQIAGEIGRLGALLGFTFTTIYGGSSYEPQIAALASGVDIVVGTPGRVMDHMRAGRLNLKTIRVAVLDEADRMLDLGFRKDIEYILRQCPKDRQTMLLSATIPEDIRMLAQRFMNEPLEVWTAPESLTVDKVEQFFCIVERPKKLHLLLKILDLENPRLAIVFCGTKMQARKLAEQLKRLYINAREIHGDLQQSRREKIMDKFRTGKLQLLIATDVASRGIDVDDVTHIINYDVPFKTEDYVHRVGRTGRMDRSGKAYTFVSADEGQYLTDIELLINREIHIVSFPSLESRWWPTPPTEPPEGYEHPTAEDQAASEYVPAGGKRGSSRDRGRSKGGRGGRSEGGRSEQPRRRSHESSAPGRNHDAPQAQPVAALAQENAAPPTDTAAVLDPGSPEGIAAAEGAARKRRKRRVDRIEIVCSQCGAQSTVRFKPKPELPVYCDVCYKARKSARMPEVPASDAPQAASPENHTSAMPADSADSVDPTEHISHAGLFSPDESVDAE